MQMAVQMVQKCRHRHRPQTPPAGEVSFGPSPHPARGPLSTIPPHSFAPEMLPLQVRGPVVSFQKHACIPCISSARMGYGVGYCWIWEMFGLSICRAGILELAPLALLAVMVHCIYPLRIFTLSILLSVYLSI